MCGRFALRTPAKSMAKAFQVREVPEVVARYNIAPAQSILSVHGGTDGREMKLLRWGLIPFWARDEAIGSRLINARSETAFEKPTFREAIKHRRCIIPADGFYEWQSMGGRKQPYFFQMRDGQPFGFAGLWDRWQGRGQVIETCAILTTNANEALSPVHERMPVILHPDDYELWLDQGPGHDIINGLMRPYLASEMISYPVSTRVNNPHFEGTELIKQV